MTDGFVRRVCVAAAGVALALVLSPSLASAVITEIIDATGDGGGNTLDGADFVAVDAAGNVFVSATLTDNAFKITPGGTITEIIDVTGDGGGNVLNIPIGVAVDVMGNVFVTERNSDNEVSRSRWAARSPRSSTPRGTTLGTRLRQPTGSRWTPQATFVWQASAASAEARTA